MSNSKLVSYTKLSPNCTRPRNHRIDTITIHCMAGDLSVETCGAVFAKVSRQASSNYGIGSDGRIALYVDEADRSWCSGSPANDHRSVTIEVANTVAAEPWPVSEKAYAALLDLVTDICRRNGIKRLLWRGDKSLIGQVDKQNMTVHRWFQNKACPGDWLYYRHGQIAEEVNRRLAGEGAKEDEMSNLEIKTMIEETVKAEIRAAEERIRKSVEAALKATETVYDTVEEVPEWGRQAVREMVDEGLIQGTGDGKLGISETLLRVLVVEHRARQMGME